MSEDWRARRQTFDSVAERYDQIRPGYPEQLFLDVIEAAELTPESQLLEIGCGTGQATLPFARCGYRMVCLEPGEQLAMFARHKLETYPRVHIEQRTFETFQSEEHFDVIFSATAFHWVDPEIRFQKVAELLKPGGTLAVWWNTHVHSDASQGFFDEVQSVYKEIAPVMVADYHGLLPPETVDQFYGKEFANASQFGTLIQKIYPWDQCYSADEYIRLLSTYSDHLLLPEHQRALLFERITALINEHYAGFITKGYAALLYIGTVED